MIIKCTKCGAYSVKPPFGGRFDKIVKEGICERCIAGQLPDMESYRKQENSMAEGGW